LNRELMRENCTGARMKAWVDSATGEKYYAPFFIDERTARYSRSSLMNFAARILPIRSGTPS
jgi:hypothetical protein